MDKNGSPLGFNRGDEAPTGLAAKAHATSTMPPQACRGRGSIKERGEPKGDGYGVGAHVKESGGQGHSGGSGVWPL
jgi:hypothetical protein